MSGSLAVLVAILWLFPPLMLSSVGTGGTTGSSSSQAAVNISERARPAPADNLLTRAADVMLKERRKLVLVVRETPFHRGHLKAMLEATEAGAIIMPPIPAFYGRPKTIDDIVNHTVGRVLDLFWIENNLLKRWGE
jgi:4-hydroxy-3-polyprenylbenzoate decarboxylase